MRSRCRRRFTRNRTAPPSLVAPLAATTTKAAFDSRARPVRRTAIARDTGGAESSTTSENAALRSSTSAHQAARAASGGRIVQNPSMSARCAQSRGASVRDASMYATHSLRPTAASTICRISVSFPDAPSTSVRRPRGKPRDASARSSASSPVDSPEDSGGGAGSNARSDSSLRCAADVAPIGAVVCGAVARAVVTQASTCRVHAVTEETPKTLPRKTDPSTVRC
jgi:hypothetical protein